MNWKTGLFLGLLISFLAAENKAQVIAANPAGVVVRVKEKYGMYTTDTCTAVLQVRGNFVLVHKDKASSWYPIGFHSVHIVKRLDAYEPEVSDVLALSTEPSEDSEILPENDAATGQESSAGL